MNNSNSSNDSLDSNDSDSDSNSDLKSINHDIQLGDKYKCEKDTDLMLYHYIKASLDGDMKGYYKIAKLFHQKRQYPLMIKYLNLCIDQKYIPAMYMLSDYHKEITYNFDEMIRLLKLAYKHGSNRAMYGIINYYESIQQDIKVEKCYNQLIDEHRDPLAMTDYGFYLELKLRRLTDKFKHFDLNSLKIENQIINLYLRTYKECHLEYALIYLGQYYCNRGKIDESLKCLKMVCRSDLIVIEREFMVYLTQIGDYYHRTMNFHLMKQYYFHVLKFYKFDLIRTIPNEMQHRYNICFIPNKISISFYGNGNINDRGICIQGKENQGMNDHIDDDNDSDWIYDILYKLYNYYAMNLQISLKLQEIKTDNTNTLITKMRMIGKYLFLSCSTHDGFEDLHQNYLKLCYDYGDNTDKFELYANGYKTNLSFEDQKAEFNKIDNLDILTLILHNSSITDDLYQFIIDENSVFNKLSVNKCVILHILKQKDLCKAIDYLNRFALNDKDLQILSNRVKNSETGNCPICYNDDKLLLYTCYNHRYCLTCTVKISSTKCPICRL